MLFGKRKFNGVIYFPTILPWTARVPPPLTELAHNKNENVMKTNEQMELGIGKTRTCTSAKRPQRRLSRANWWFQQMREVVDKAVDWQPAPPARPEQIYFPE